MEEQFSAVALSISITVSVFLSAVLFDDYIYTLKLFRDGSGQQISLAFAAFGSRSTIIFSSIIQISSVVKFFPLRKRCSIEKGVNRLFPAQ